MYKNIHTKKPASVARVVASIMEIIIKSVAVMFLTLSLIDSSWALKDDGSHIIATSPQKEPVPREPVTAPSLSRVKRQFAYGYGVPYYGLYRRPYPVPVPILIGGGFVGGRGFGGFGGRGFGGRGFGGRGFGGRGFGGRGIGGRGGFGGGRGGIGGGRGGRG